MFWCSHVKREDITEAFTDTMCEVIGKGINHLMNNWGTNPPTPQAANKQKVVPEIGVIEE
jgi:hypothetical protein